MTRSRDRLRAMTLIEVVLTAALMVPLMGILFWFYSSSLESREQANARVRDVQLARVVMDRMAGELRQATGFAGGYGAGVFGTRHAISINAVAIPDRALVERRGIRDEPLPGQFDLRQIDYYIAWDEENLDENGDPRALGLVRRERRTFNQLAPADTEETAAGPGGTQGDESGLGGEDLDEELTEKEALGSKYELYAPELKFIEFFYHDGYRWWDSWEIFEGNALPQMVMITIGYVPELPEDEEIEIMKDLLLDEDDIEPIASDRYVRVVRIRQADSLFFGPRLQREASASAELEDVE